MGRRVGMAGMRAAAFLCLILCSGCASRGGEIQNASIRIGVSLYRGDDTFINNIRDELEKKAKTYEQETGIRVSLDFQDAKGSQSTQDSQVERLIALDCDALCINPVDRMAASGIIDKAIAAQVPVVFFNRQPVEEDMDRWDQLFYVGIDAKQSAILEGTILARFYEAYPSQVDRNGDGVISYVLLEGENNHQDALIRTEWSIQSIKDSGAAVERLAGNTANWERSQGSALMEQWLEQYPDRIEAVISNNDDMALGAVDALERAGVADIPVVGIDGTTPAMEAVKKGAMLGTVCIDKERYAGAIFELAASRALDQPLPQEYSLEEGQYYFCPQQIVTKFD